MCFLCGSPNTFVLSLHSSKRYCFRTKERGGEFLINKEYRSSGDRLSSQPRGRSITNDSCVPGAVRRGDGRRARLFACNSACVDVTSHQLPRYENPETNRQLRDNLAISLKRNIFTGPSRESPARRGEAAWMTSRHPLSSARSRDPSSALGFAFHARVYFMLIRISSKITFEIEHN